MRTKAALLIIVMTFVIIALNLGFNLYLTRGSLTESLSKDAELALEIANGLVSSKIDAYETSARKIAANLSKADTPESMEIAMREQLAEYPDFIAFTVFGGDGIYAKYGDSPTAEYRQSEDQIANALNGRTSITTTGRNEASGKLVMYVCAPMGDGFALSATIPGTVFSEMLEKFNFWASGNIVLSDSDGKVIAHNNHEAVETQLNYINRHGKNTPAATQNFFDELLASESGSGKYKSDGVEYYSVYRKLTGSDTGWYLIINVLMSESPVTLVQNSLITMAVLIMAVGVITALFLSGNIVKPYNKIAEQNRALEELNEISKTQAAKLQEAHQRTMLMMDAVPICSMLWDKDGNIFDCNEESVRTFKVKDKAEFIERFYDFSPEEQPNGRTSVDMVKDVMNKTYTDGRCVFEWMHQLTDGTPVPCWMTLVRVRYEDEYIIAAYAQDQREIKKMMAEALRLQAELKAALKEAQDANRAKSSFLASMSHEMRTPLNAVVGLSELLLNTSRLETDVEEKLDKVHTSGMTLLGIVNDILDLSKIESGRFEMHPAEYDTPSLINDIVSLNIMRISEKPITFKLYVDERLPVLIYGDDLRVKQIFNNLLSNAFKYTNSGTVEWSVTFETDGYNIWLISYVKDSGIGIKKEDIRKLFRDYSQVDAETNRKAEGTGLGLAITKRLIEMMNGIITVESEYGKGSTFKVRLRQKFVSDVPIGRATADNLMGSRFTSLKRLRSANIIRIDLSYANILLVDDVQTNLDVIKGMLKPYKARIDCAMSGYQALEMLRAGKLRYDAIFMDHMMPGMDGIETTRIIREEIESGSAKKIPIIALTANALSGNEKIFLDNGFQAYISKPIDMMRLDSVLRQWVRDKDREIAALRETAMPAQTDQNAGGEERGIERGYNYTAASRNEFVTAAQAVPAPAPAPAPVSAMQSTLAPAPAIPPTIASVPIMPSRITPAPAAPPAVTMAGCENRYETPGAAAAASPYSMDYTDAGPFEYLAQETAGGMEGGAGFAVEGLDSAAGIRLFNGDVESYADVLKSYTSNTPQILVSMDKYLSENNLKDYAIAIHGIKGSSYGVCAAQAGKEAEQLEKLAKSGDAEQVFAKHGAFVEYISKFLKTIQDALPNLTPEPDRRMLDEPEQTLLIDLYEACRRKDKRSADSLMSRLESCDYLNNGEIVEWFRGQIGQIGLTAKRDDNGTFPV